MRKYTVFVPGRPPGGNARQHWTAAAKSKEFWGREAWLLSLEAKQKWEREHKARFTPMEKCTLVMTFVVPDLRHRDEDNLVTSVKAELDGIVKAGIIRDDRMTCIVQQGPHKVRVERGKTGTEFMFTEVE